jgi:GAF domain-containing protein
MIGARTTKKQRKRNDRDKTMTTLLKMKETRTAGGRMLRAAMEETGSTCGFTAVVVEQGLRILEHDGITWHQPTRRDSRVEPRTRSERTTALEFTNLDNLVGQVLRGAAPVVVNDPQDPRLGRLPLVAYPPLHSVLGVPVFDGDAVVGVIGVANRFHGYSTQDRERLQSVAGRPGLRRAV